MRRTKPDEANNQAISAPTKLFCSKNSLNQHLATFYQNKLTIATIAVMIKAITQRFSTFNNIFFVLTPTNVNILFKKYFFLKHNPYIFILILIIIYFNSNIPL